MSGFLFIPSGELKLHDYDERMSEDPFGIYNLSWYMHCVSKKWGVYLDPETGDYFPVAYKQRPGYKNVYQPFFCMFSVPCVSREEQIHRALKIMMEEFQHAELHLPNVIKSLSLPGVRYEQRIRQEAEIKDVSSAREKFSENALRQVRKAGKESLRIEYDISPEIVARDFFDHKGNQLKEIGNEEIRTLGTLMRTATTEKKGFSIACYKEKIRLASAYFLDHGNRLIYLKGSVSEEGKKVGALYFLFDEVIQQYAGKKTILDFGGSNVKNVADFYHRLGGQDKKYTRLVSDPRGVARIVSGLKKLSGK